MALWRGIIEEFRAWLPVTEATPVVTLQEGDTPLLRAHHLSQVTGLEVYLKFEGANPTGSFKDRGMTLAVSKAVEGGAKAIACASTGNTSASAAAYAARAGIVCAVLIPKGKVAPGKLAQALVHGARVIELDGNFDQALDIARNLTTGSRGVGCTCYHSNARIRHMDETASQYYILLEVDDRPGVLARVAQTFADHGVSIRSMWQEGFADEARLVMVTHRALERNFQALLGALRGLDVVEEVASSMRVITDEE